MSDSNYNTHTVNLGIHVGYDNVRNPLLVIISKNPSVDCNHTLQYLSKPWSIVNGKIFDVVALDQRFTTKDACEEFIKPMTRTCQTSMVDMLVANPSLAVHVVPAEAFISHAWKYSFAAVVDTMALWYETTREERVQKSHSDQQQQQQITSSPDTCFLWFDIGTVAQHASAQKAFPPNYFFNQFRQGIESIGCTVIVLMPLFNPVPLTRAWCV